MPRLFDKKTFPKARKDGAPRRDYARKPSPHRNLSMLEGVQQLWGLHTVEAALLNPKRRHQRLLATENAWKKLESTGAQIKPEIVHPRDLDKLLGRDTVHQGVLLESYPIPSPALEKAEAKGCFLALDQITDPHNVGAILRTASAFNVRGIIMTERYSPQMQGVLAKAASGALEYVPLHLVKNLRKSMAALKERGFTAVGLDSEGPETLDALNVKLPLLLVLGAEGKGLRPSVREDCDNLARIDLPGDIKSLNVSNAAALALYIAAQKI